MLDIIIQQNFAMLEAVPDLSYIVLIIKNEDEYQEFKKSDVTINAAEGAFLKECMYLKRLGYRKMDAENSKLYAFPLYYEDQAFGVFGFYAKKGQDAFVPFGKQFAKQLSASIHCAKLSSVEYRLSLKDNTTDLFHKKYVFERISEWMTNEKNNISVVMLDIDNFKQVNDRHGHVFGDKVLKEIASVLKDTVRKQDIVGRYGGEEFILVFKNKPLNIVTDITNRILSRIQDTVIIDPALRVHYSVTVSAGIATYNGTETVRELVHRSDKALYEAKENGKNRLAITSA